METEGNKVFEAARKLGDEHGPTFQGYYRFEDDGSIIFTKVKTKGELEWEKILAVRKGVAAGKGLPLLAQTFRQTVNKQVTQGFAWNLASSVMVNRKNVGYRDPTARLVLRQVTGICSSCLL